MIRVCTTRDGTPMNETAVCETHWWDEHIVEIAEEAYLVAQDRDGDEPTWTRVSDDAAADNDAFCLACGLPAFRLNGEWTVL